MPRQAVTRATLRKAGKHWDISGVDELIDNVERVLKHTSAKELKGVYFEAGKLPRDRAKALAPYNPKRKTGTHLRDAIFVAPGEPEESNVLVGVSRKRKGGAPHGLLIEYGVNRAKTGNVPARPFFRPAVAETRQAMAKIIITGFLAAVEKAPK